MAKKPTETTALARTIPQGLIDSIRALRKAAGAAKSLAEWRQAGRYATAEEIAASEALRKATDCSGHSARTGLACALPRVHGMTCCRRHGGSLKRVRAKAARRLREIAMPVIESMYQAATQTENLGAAVKAGADLLDRSGVGALVQAKVRSSKRDAGGNKIQVRIGFLTRNGGEALTVEVPSIEAAKE